MPSNTERLAALGVQSPTILLPKKEIDLEKWAVVACDQYTSEVEYWQRVEAYVGAAPSTLQLIYPEVYLEEEHPQRRIATINETMDRYLRDGIFDTYEKSFFLVHREDEGGGPGRWGLLATLDLEHYDWSKGSKTLIRASEETILDRIPPRKAIRKDARFELPHILVLIDDQQRQVIESLKEKRTIFPEVYSTRLMEGGGHVTAWQINTDEVFGELADHLEALIASQDSDSPLLFAMGDGNHSLATAKSCWLDIKKGLSEEEIVTHPARYALVEIQNIYDPGIVFEPIHRLLFSIDYSTFTSTLASFCTSFETTILSSLEELDIALEGKDGIQRFGYSDANQFLLFELNDPASSLAAGTIQKVIDRLLEETKTTVDYTHGEEVTLRLGTKPTNAAIILPPFSKEAFFKTVIEDGSLPRKTFSMGHAHQKRYYLEGRMITQSVDA